MWLGARAAVHIPVLGAKLARARVYTCAPTARSLRGLGATPASLSHVVTWRGPGCYTVLAISRATRSLTTSVAMMRTAPTRVPQAVTALAARAAPSPDCECQDPAPCLYRGACSAKVADGCSPGSVQCPAGTPAVNGAFALVR